MKSTNTINSYHAHAYYSDTTIEEAKTLVHLAKEKFDVEIGRFHEKPVGPHPEWSCQITVPPEKFSSLIPWLALNRGNINFFIHPETGNDLIDHTEHIMWLGKSFELNIDMFKK